MKVFDTYSMMKKDFSPSRNGVVNMYVCGITAYDYCHIGHARSLIVFDTIYRYLSFKGYQVKFVRNFTDIDDKIIARAMEEGARWDEIAENYIKAFYEDTAPLNLKTPFQEPRASHHIPEIIALIEGLIEKGLAYKSGGDVYFRVRNFQDYGKLSGKKIDELLIGARVEKGENKEDPLDFALWKGAKPGEPFWESPFGPGRPGWHIECSAMSMKYLGNTLDIHGGGQDLIFPHHENEIAQSQGWSGKRFVRYWLHNGFVNIEGEKMSKSTGNFILIRDVLKRFHPETLRLFMISRHYRSPLDYREEELHTCERSLIRLYSALEEVEEEGIEGKNTEESERYRKGREEIDIFFHSFIEAMDDDFNTPKALSCLFDLVRVINRIKRDNEGRGEMNSVLREARKRLKEAGNILGILFHSKESIHNFMKEKVLKESGITEERIEELIEQRNRFRKEGDFVRADEIRSFLHEKGVILEDRVGKTTWRVR